MKNSRNLIATLAVILLVILVRLAWPVVENVLDPPGNEKVVVVMKTIGPDMEFWQVVRAGIQAASAELAVSPVIVGPRWERDIDRQIEILANVIEQSPHGILLAAADFNRLAPLAERAADRGITIVTMDSALNSTVPVSFVATDNVEAGEKAGRELNRLVPPDRKIAVISHIQGVATAIDREEGVQRALAQRDPATIVGTFYAENELDRAYEIVIDLVQSYPDLGGIAALNENSTIGAGRAIRDLGLAGTIRLVGFDNSQEEIEFLEKGIVDALVVQKPFNMGYLGITTLVQAIRGRTVDPIIYTDSVLVRPDEIFTEENQKLLFPLVQPR